MIGPSPDVNQRLPDGSTTNGTAVNPPPLWPNPLEIQRNTRMSLSGVLDQADIALRTDRRLARQMLRDPDIFEPLCQLMLFVADLDWKITPDDDEDERQVEQADQIESLIRKNMRRQHAFLLSNMWAVWYGRTMVNIIYERNADGETVPLTWQAIHPDSLVTTDKGRVGFKSNAGTTRLEKVFGVDTPVHLLDDTERRAVIIHDYLPWAADFEDFRESEYHWRGRGYRDILWYFWWMKQKVLQDFIDWITIHSHGMRIGRYPDGESEAKAIVEELLKNWNNEVSIAVPRRSVDPDQYSFEVLSPSAEGARVMLDVLEGYFADKFKGVILCQRATSSPVSEGLGTGVSTRHAETFQKLISFVAGNLQDALTHDFVHVLQEMNFGEGQRPLRWEFSIEKVDPNKWMEAVEKFLDIGGTVKEDQAREVLGFTRPDEGDDILEKQAGFDLGGGGLFDQQDGGLDFQRVTAEAEKLMASLNV